MALHTIEWVKNLNGNPNYLVHTYPEGDSETFKKGAILKWDDSEDGVVEIALSSGVPTTQTILGFALQDASGTSDTDIDVLIPRPGDVFSAMVGSAEGTLAAPGRDLPGQLVGLIKFSTAATAGADHNSQTAAGTEYGVDTGNTNWAKVVDYDYRDLMRVGGSAADVSNLQAGDRVLFTILNSVLDSDGTQA